MKLENGTLSVEAEVLSIQSKSIFNINDNVKTISLTVKNASGVMVQSPINNHKIESRI